MPASTGSAVNDALVAPEAKIEQLAPGGLAKNTVADITARNGGQPVAGTVNSRPGPEQQQYSMHSFGALFHAPSKRIRDLPIRLERAMDA